MDTGEDVSSALNLRQGRGPALRCTPALALSASLTHLFRRPDVSVKPVIQCDGTPGGPGTQCPAEGKPALPWHTTATKVRRFLHTQQGWRRTGDGRDICPLCREEGSYKPGCAPSASWCGTCSRRRPCWCDIDEQEDPFPLPGDDPDAPWDGNPETAPEAAAGAIGL